ncbi:MAG: response regulator transcription factor [Bryobacteraceae bacterium]
MNTTRVRVAAFSDQPMLLMGLEALVETDPLLDLAISCTDLADFRKRVALARAGVLLLDITPEVNFAVLKELQDLNPGCKVVLWAESVTPEFALQALAAGVSGILRKNLSLDTHRRCFHKVHAGELWFEKSVTESAHSARRVALSRREGQLVGLLSRGMSNKQIAGRLGISEGTVKVYLSHLYQKSGVRDRFDLALCGLKNFQMHAAPGKFELRITSLIIDTPRAEA